MEQIQMRCLESYLPRGGTAAQDLQDHWMWAAFTEQHHGRALTCSMSALSLARMGMVAKDQGLIASGRDQYAQALASLQYALYDPMLAFQDTTLAAIRALSIYEVRRVYEAIYFSWFLMQLQILVPTFAAVPSGRTHEDGMTQWCLAAGPHRFSTAFAVHVFHDVRWCIVSNVKRVVVWQH